MCRHRAVDEISHDGGTALVVQRAGSHTFERSARHCRRLEESIDYFRETRVAARPFLDLASERSDGSRHGSILASNSSIETIETRVVVALGGMVPAQSIGPK